MGFFNKIVKSVTGSWADIVVDTQPMTPGLSRKFGAQISVRDQPIEFTSIVAVVRCIEEARVTVSSAGDDGVGTRTRTDSDTVHENTVELRGAGTFAAGHVEEFEFPVAIPREGPFSFKGQHVELRWEVEVSIDMKGNDPDSGWTPFTVGSPE